MRVVFLNPNASQDMTDSIAATARAVLPEAEIACWTNTKGPPAIQGAEDGARAVPGLLELLAPAEAHGASAIVIACFDDTGLDRMRAAAQVPVIGIGQAAFHLAALRAGRFSVLTTMPASVPVIEANIAAQGFAGICDGVVASGIPVLEVEHGGAAVTERLAVQIAGMAEAGARSIVLGCAGMSRHLAALQRETVAPLVDPVGAAALLVTAVIGAGPRAVPVRPEPAGHHGIA